MLLLVTFKDLQKLVQSNTNEQFNSFDLQTKLQGKPFWIWDQHEHRQIDIVTKGQCCF